MGNLTPRISHLDEPLLEFGMRQKLVYPRDGLYLFGPVGDTQVIRAISYGVIGTPRSVELFRGWSESLAHFVDKPEPGVRSRAIEPQHVPFPGFESAFGAHWPPVPSAVIDDIQEADLRKALHIENHYEAVRRAVDLFVARLVKANNTLEHPPTVWFVVIPEVVFSLGRPLSAVRKSERVAASVTLSKRDAQRLEREPTLFGDREKEAEVYQYAPHFRRQLKARLLEDRIVTQIVRETTLAPEAFVNKAGRPSRRLEDPATIAWNFATGTYYKAGGKPWQLANVRPGVCYVGLVYKKSSTLDERTSVCAAQMFLTDGEGIVFRGALGPWYRPDTRQFHLDANAARNLVSMVVAEYVRQYGKPPKELFIHAQSRFSGEEWSGFRSAVSAETSLVGVQIKPVTDTKLYRLGNYPVIRGSVMYLNDHAALLWTTGYTPRLDTYMGPDTPNPLSVRVTRGGCDLDVVLRDVLALTKINFNACVHHDRFPVTIKFANEVGDVLAAAPSNCEPRLPFKFYI